MSKVREYTADEAKQIRDSEHKFNPGIDADGNYYLSIKAAELLSQIPGFEWAAPDETNLITYKPTTDV